MLYHTHSISQLMAQHVNTKESAGRTKHIITAPHPPPPPPITDTGPLPSHLLLQTVRSRPAGDGGFPARRGRGSNLVGMDSQDVAATAIIVIIIVFIHLILDI